MKVLEVSRHPSGVAAFQGQAPKLFLWLLLVLGMAATPYLLTAKSKTSPTLRARTTKPHLGQQVLVLCQVCMGIFPHHKDEAVLVILEEIFFP